MVCYSLVPVETSTFSQRNQRWSFWKKEPSQANIVREKQFSKRDNNSFICIVAINPLIQFSVPQFMNSMK